MSERMIVVWFVVIAVVFSALHDKTLFEVLFRAFLSLACGTVLILIRRKLGV